MRGTFQAVAADNHLAAVAHDQMFVLKAGEILGHPRARGANQFRNVLVRRRHCQSYPLPSGMPKFSLSSSSINATRSSRVQPMKLEQRNCTRSHRPE